MSFSYKSQAQISKQQAINYVMDSIVGNRSDSVNVFMDSDSLSTAFYYLSPYDSIQSPFSDYWLFFIDESPLFTWGHNCSYVFIDVQNGNNFSQSEQLPPLNLENVMEQVSVPLTFTLPAVNQNISTAFTIPDENINCNLYAVLVNNQPYLFSDLYHLYNTLLENGYAEENIFVFSRDGTLATNETLDLNLDGIDDILNMECSISNLQSKFDDLAEVIGKDDMFFFYSNSPITTDQNIQGESIMKLWNNEPLDDDYFATNMIQPINCAQMFFIIANSNSGGMLDNLVNLNNNDDYRVTGLAESEWGHYGVASQSFIQLTGMHSFPFWSISAMRGYYPDYNSDAPWNRGYEIGYHSNFAELSDKTEKDFDKSEYGGNNDNIFQINEISKFISEYDYDDGFADYGVTEIVTGFVNDDLLSLHGISGSVETSQTLSGSFLIGGSLSVEPGVVLTLDNSTSFHVFDSEVIIKPGIESNNDIIVESGKLIANGATFTNACDTPWKGIEVWGNINHHQFDLPGQKQAQGRLVLNKAIIENADIAVTLYDREDSDPTTGGIITAEGSSFLNNERAIEFRMYTNLVNTNNTEYDYISSFENCTFVIDNNYLHNNYLFEGSQININGVKGIKIKGCSFENLLSNTPNGRAIHACNAGFIVDDGCSNNQQPCTVAESSFKGFETAIEAGNSENSLNPINIKNSDFTYNGTGITFYRVNNSVIVHNTFDLGYGSRCANNQGKGIYLDNSHSFAIEDNTFKVTNSQGGTHYVGIHTNNTNNAGDEIYNNNFTDMNISNFAEGKNWNRSNKTGLAYYCNENTLNNWDFYVKDYNTYEDGIQKFQGSESMAAGNEFSSTAYYHFDNNGAYWISYFYDNNSTPEIPDINKLYRVRPESLTLSSYCPNHYGNGNDVKLTSAEYTQKESDYNSVLSSYNSALLSYEGANDSTLKEYYAKQISYYNTLVNRAAYDIIRSNMSDTIVQDSLFAVWQQKLNTYTSAESMVDFYLQKGDYTKAWNTADSLKYNFTFTAYDSIEYPYYLELKELQISWLEKGRDVFDLNTSEISKLETIADSSRGTAGAQARAILSFAFDTTYFYTNCVTMPDTSQKSAPIAKGIESLENNIWIIANPNPASNHITFSYSIGQKANADLKLYNQNGVLIDEIILEKGSNIYNYNCSNYKAGIYYYSSAVENKTLTGKFVIIK